MHMLYGQRNERGDRVCCWVVESGANGFVRCWKEGAPDRVTTTERMSDGMYYTLWLAHSAASGKFGESGSETHSTATEAGEWVEDWLLSFVY